MNWKVKRILDDIIDNAYPEESENRKKFFKWFTIELKSEPNGTYLGVYKEKEKKIIINSLNTSDAQVIVTCIHELAHHIDKCKNGSTGHQAPFYEEYKTLLYTALNMKLFRKEDFAIRETRDFNKVKKMLDEWIPEDIEYKQGLLIIKANVPFNCKDMVKSHGYHWNSIERTWDKEVAKEESTVEEQWLTSIGVTEISVTDASVFSLDAIGYVKAGEGSFDYKDNLKADGFFYSNKAWYKKIYSKEYNEYSRILKEKYPTIQFKLVNEVK